MTAVDWSAATLDDALRSIQHRQGGHGEPLAPPFLLPSWKTQQRRLFRSVFQTDISQPTPQATPVVGFPDQGQAFGGPLAAAAGRASLSQASEDLDLPDASDSAETEGPQRKRAAPGAGAEAERTAADDQIRFDRAWHVVTARISLPSSVAAEDSFGTLAPESQPLPAPDAAAEAEFQDALRLVLQAPALLPRATHVEDVLAWHTHQVRRHYAQHVLPLLAACVGEPPAVVRRGDTAAAAGYDYSMDVIVNSVRTLEAAFRLYFYGLTLLVRGLPPHGEGGGGGGGGVGQPTAAAALGPDAVVSRFRQDVNALVANSMPPGLVVAIRAILARFCSAILGLDAQDETKTNSTPFRRRSAQGAPIAPTYKAKSAPGTPRPPRPPAENDSRVQRLRRQMHEVLGSLCGVGLAGERFQILFAEIMDEMMVEFIQLSFSGRWGEAGGGGGGGNGRLRQRPSTKGSLSASSSIGVLFDWVENHFARLAHEVLSQIGTGAREAVSFSDVKKWKDVALSRLSALRMTELFDIVLHWPLSRGGLEDLRVSVTTPQRRSQLVATFSAALRKRLLHPACSTLEILQIYVAMIRTFHVLDPSNVLLSAAVGPLQFYLCQREDAVRIVVDGLLADPEDAAAANGTVADRIARTRSGGGGGGPSALSAAPSPSPKKLVELAGILNDPSQQRRRHIDEEELDWNDMEWVPDPIDAGTNYRRPKSEDVVGTLIGALGSREAFTKEFQNIIAERLLSSQVVFAKEVKVLNLLKKRFGESSLQSCEVMIRDIQDSNRLNAIIHQLLQQQDSLHAWTRRVAGSAAAAAAAAAAASRGRGQQDEDGMDLGTDAAAAGALDTDLQYQTKILSRLYWPGLGREDFLLPRPVATMQKRFEAGYEDRKAGRKLTWLGHLGQASVELELADRTVAVECKTYEAAVVYAFQDEDEDEDEDGDGTRPPVRRTVPELVDMLQMDEDLVVLALGFWHKQGVLRPEPHNPESYAVVESVAAAAAAEAEAAQAAEAAEAEAQAQAEAQARAGGGESDAGSGSPAPGEADDDGEAGAGPAARAGVSKRQARADDAQRTVYWQFIVGMLTNSAASMPVTQIGMMLKMLVADGFAWSDEELQEFLAEKVADGSLEVVGGKYRLVK